MSSSLLHSILVDYEYYSNVGHGDCNCDCACSHTFPSTQMRVESNNNRFGNIWENSYRLIAPKELFVSPLNESWYVISNPLSPSGRVLVINSTILQTIELFRNARSISSAMKELNWIGIDVEGTLSNIRYLYDHHILVFEDWVPFEAVNVSDTLTAWIHVTNECNLRCAYCYLQKTPDYMTEDIGKKAIEELFRAAKNHNFKSIKLKFSGGEASLNINLVFFLVNHAQSLASEENLSLDVVLLSNGVGFSRKLIERLINKKIRLMISLDGIGYFNDTQRKFKNGKGSFKTVTRSLDRMLGLGLIPEISITITSKNIEGLPNLIRYLLQIDRNFPFSLNYYRQHNFSEPFDELKNNEDRMIHYLELTYDVIEEYLPERSLLGSLSDRANLLSPHNKTCGVGDNYIVIDEQGNISKCQMTIGDTLGSIQTPDLDIIELVRHDQSGILNTPVLEKESCRECLWRNWCTGGCPAYTYQVSGRYDVKSPNCRIYKTTFPRILRLEGLRILRKAETPLTDYTSC